MLSSSTSKHFSMAAVILCSMAAGTNIIVGNFGLALLMGALAGLNIMTTFYHARREVELEDQD